ncbi:Hypothetical protein NTJ_06765 [Nesidiocoris tenuis]|uniref:Uncharacterized protein n=1 Tax=Nesidiocoris tenuis TaxID=355587 RepID=A0ABN7AP04_9HEMI|nr:Hypothetical protein NTJ_06765 [Nesidiocoris tenuis]
MGRVCSIFGDKGGQELSAIQQQQLDDLSKRFPLLGLMMGRAPGPSANQFSTAPLIVPIILPLPNVDGRDGFFDEFFDKFDKFVCKDKHKDPIHNSHGHYEVRMS